MAEIKKLMERDEKGIDRQYYPETVPEAITGLDKIITGKSPVLSVNGQTGAVNLSRNDIGISESMLLSSEFRAVLEQVVADYQEGKLGGSIELEKVEEDA